MKQALARSPSAQPSRAQTVAFRFSSGCVSRTALCETSEIVTTALKQLLARVQWLSKTDVRGIVESIFEAEQEK